MINIPISNFIIKINAGKSAHNNSMEAMGNVYNVVQNAKHVKEKTIVKPVKMIKKE